MHEADLPYSWANVQRHFPPAEVVRLRQRLVEEYRSAMFTSGELAARYRMTERALYQTLRRYANARTLGDYRDRPKAPKDARREYSDDDVGRLKALRAQDEARIEKKGPSTASDSTPRDAAWRRPNSWAS